MVGSIGYAIWLLVVSRIRVEAPENAMVALRTAQGIASGWCKQPTGLFVQALKNGARAEEADTVIAAKVYPHPTLELAR